MWGITRTSNLDCGEKKSSFEEVQFETGPKTE